MRVCVFLDIPQCLGHISLILELCIVLRPNTQPNNGIVQSDHRLVRSFATAPSIVFFVMQRVRRTSLSFHKPIVHIGVRLCKASSQNINQVADYDYGSFPLLCVYSHLLFSSASIQFLYIRACRQALSHSPIIQATIPYER